MLSKVNLVRNIQSRLHLMKTERQRETNRKLLGRKKREMGGKNKRKEKQRRKEEQRKRDYNRKKGRKKNGEIQM